MGGWGSDGWIGLVGVGRGCDRFREPRVTHVGVHQGLEVNDMVGIALR